MPSAKKNMNIFTDRFKNEQPKQDWKKEILDSILTTGTATANVRIVIGDKPNNITERSSGLIRIKRSLEDKFKVIIGRPDLLLSFDRDKIRCCLCNRVIAFNQAPVWYYSIRYAVNHFHYFVCADKQSLEEQKPNTHCYRR